MYEGFIKEPTDELKKAYLENNGLMYELTASGMWIIYASDGVLVLREIPSHIE